MSRMISLGEVKTLNTKPEKCCSRESLAHWYTILLLSFSQRSASGSTQTFTTINKSLVWFGFFVFMVYQLLSIIQCLIVFYIGLVC